MNLDSRDLYDSSSVLSNWENEGGARGAPDSASRYASDDVLISFGQSVAMHWNELPHDFKQAVFQEIARRHGAPDPELKERAARFLHDNSSHLPKASKRFRCAPRDDNDSS